MWKFFALVEIEVADDQGVNEMERNNVINATSLVWCLDVTAEQRAEKRCADDLLIKGSRGVPSIDTLCGCVHLFDKVFLRLCYWPSVGHRRHSSSPGGELPQAALSIHRAKVVLAKTFSE
jgi:hypothetical protein